MVVKILQGFLMQMKEIERDGDRKKKKMMRDSDRKLRKDEEGVG